MSTIQEKILDKYPEPVSLDSTEKIIEQMKKNVCKIHLDNGKGTGFFGKIFFPDKDHLLPVLITNNHVIDKSIINKENSVIAFSINDNIIKTIELNNRLKYTNEKYDITIIEINEKKDEIKDFLELEQNIYSDNENQNYIYNNESIYLLHYYNSINIAVSYGLLKYSINNSECKYNFQHFCNTDRGSSGSPILSLKTNKVIGIHKLAIVKEIIILDYFLIIQ